MFKLLNENAIQPVRGTPQSAGFDVYASETVVIEPGVSKPVGTSIALSFPSDTVCFIKPRSGLALKHSIDVLAGVVDSDYTGEVKVILINHGKETFVANKGDRIAQLVFLQLSTCCIGITNTIKKRRGSDGFGSTGFHN